MNDADILRILQNAGAIITGTHVVYTSGRHGSTYVNKDALFPYTHETNLVCARLAEHFVNENAAVVAGPTVGGVIMAQWVAHHLRELTGQAVMAVYAEEHHISKQRVFRRGYDRHLTDQRVLIVDDVLTTGGSARKMVSAVRAAGGLVVGVGALCNRGVLTAEVLDVPRLVAMTEIPMKSWDAVGCPLCHEGVPMNTQVGKGAEFLARQQQSNTAAEE